MYFNPERSSSNLVLEASSDGAFTAIHMIYSDASQIFNDKISHLPDCSSCSLSHGEQIIPSFLVTTFYVLQY